MCPQWPNTHKFKRLTVDLLTPSLPFQTFHQLELLLAYIACWLFAHLCRQVDSLRTHTVPLNLTWSCTETKTTFWGSLHVRSDQNHHNHQFCPLLLRLVCQRLYFYFFIFLKSWLWAHASVMGVVIWYLNVWNVNKVFMYMHLFVQYNLLAIRV